MNFYERTNGAWVEISATHAASRAARLLLGRLVKKVRLSVRLLYLRLKVELLYLRLR